MAGALEEVARLASGADPGGPRRLQLGRVNAKPLVDVIRVEVPARRGPTADQSA
jgi:hypothetical protein